MGRRASICLLAVVALALPWAAVAAQHCMAAAPCLMASSMAAAGCHQAAVQSLDCCRSSGGEASQEAVPAAADTAVATDAGSASPRADNPVHRLAAGGVEASAAPLYTLFRALLI